MFPPLLFSGKFCVELYYFFLKYLIEFTSEVIWTWKFSWEGFFSPVNSISVINNKAIWGLHFLSEPCLLFQRFCLFHLTCQIYCNKVVHNTLLFFLISLYSVMMISPFLFLILIICVFSLFFPDESG